jgi:hypothetical protein
VPGVAFLELERLVLRHVDRAKDEVNLRAN